VNDGTRKTLHQQRSKYLAAGDEPPAAMVTKSDVRKIDEYIKKRGLGIPGWRKHKRPALQKPPTTEISAP
jgi:hypothetical protein